MTATALPSFRRTPESHLFPPPLRKKGERDSSVRWNDGRWLLLALLFLLPACSNLFSRSPQQNYETAVQAWEEGRVREARIALMNALQAEPGNKQARLLQALMFLETGDGIAAEAELARAREAGATPEETRHLFAHSRLLHGDPQAAIRIARAAAPAQRSHAERVIGLALLAMGDQKAAMAAFDRSIAADPKNSRTWLDVARFRRSLGDLGPALIAADKAVEANPRNGTALVLRGELTRTQFGLAAAVPWFDRALEVDSGNLQALLERASTFGDMGRMQAMLADTRAALALQPGHPLPYFLQATLAARGRDFGLARNLLGRTNRAFDNVPAGILLASVLSYEAGDYEDAERRLSRLARLQPGNVKARRLLAAARLRLDDAEGAIDAVRTLADRPDADSYTLTLVAAALERQGNAALAARYRERAARPQQSALAALLWSDNSHPEVAAVGQLLAQGASDEALARARQLQQSWPGVAASHLLVGDVLAARGDHRGAADAYRSAANLSFTESAAVRLIGSLGRAGDARSADAVLHLFASQNPRNLSAQMMLAARALAGGQWQEAIARYEGLRARIGNGDASLMNNLAWAYAGAEDYDRALLYARRAWLLAPGNPATAETLGWALYRHGDVAQGLLLLSTAARGRPADALLRPTEVAGR